MDDVQIQYIQPRSLLLGLKDMVMYTMSVYIPFAPDKLILNLDNHIEPYNDNHIEPDKLILNLEQTILQSLHTI